MVVRFFFDAHRRRLSPHRGRTRTGEQQREFICRRALRSAFVSDERQVERWRDGRTEFEEVDPGLVPPDVEVVVEQAPALEAELREVVPAVVAE